MQLPGNKQRLQKVPCPGWWRSVSFSFNSSESCWTPWKIVKTLNEDKFKNYSSCDTGGLLLFARWRELWKWESVCCSISCCWVWSWCDLTACAAWHEHNKEFLKDSPQRSTITSLPLKLLHRNPLPPEKIIRFTFSTVCRMQKATSWGEAL